MIKNYKFFCIMCLIVCLMISGCGKKSADNDGDATSGENIIYAPTDIGSDDQARDTSAKEDTTVSTPDTTDSEPPEDTTQVPETDAATEPEPETDKVAEPPEDTQEPITSEIIMETIKLDDSFLSGESASGTIVSRQSEKIRLVVNYDCQMYGDGSVTVNLQVGLESYDINCGARVNTGKLTVDGITHTFSTDAIAHEARTLVYVPFASYTHQIDAGQTSCKIDASWLFNGVYAGVKLDTLAVGATLEWGLPRIAVE